MTPSAISRHGLERRRAQLFELQRYLQLQESEFLSLHGKLQAFIERYVDKLSACYLELDALESQLHTATRYLAEALNRNGVATKAPRAPQATALPKLLCLPAAAPLPAEPPGGLVDLAPPSLKTLYRRAAMRLHPDFADNEAERKHREQVMMQVNEAYKAERRQDLEALLLAAGEDPVKVSGGNADALRTWLGRCETAVQGRLRVVQAHLVALQAHPMHQLWQAISHAETLGLDPFSVMAQRLRSQINERRQELYIGQRLLPEPGLAEDFLRRRIERMGAEALGL